MVSDTVGFTSLLPLEVLDLDLQNSQVGHEGHGGFPNWPAQLTDVDDLDGLMYHANLRTLRKQIGMAGWRL